MFNFLMKSEINFKMLFGGSNYGSSQMSDLAAIYAVVEDVSPMELDVNIEFALGDWKLPVEICCLVPWTHLEGKQQVLFKVKGYI